MSLITSKGSLTAIIIPFLQHYSAASQGFGTVGLTLQLTGFQFNQ